MPLNSLGFPELLVIFLIVLAIILIARTLTKRAATGGIATSDEVSLQPSAGTQPAAGQPQRIVVVATKNVGLAIALAFFFGPLGLLYSTILGGVVMFLVNLVVGVITLGVGLFLTWPICAVWAYIAAKSHNETLLAGTRQF